MIIYYPDVNLENFVYNEYERRVKIIDLEYVVIVERELFSQMNSRTKLNSNKFCNTYMSDYNVEQGNGKSNVFSRCLIECLCSLSVCFITVDWDEWRRNFK